ncbi:MAG TPA: response regulator [Longimicrobiaceae bacterium]|nr:response regulator [Longimicrobiaceae bacterium]
MTQRVLVIEDDDGARDALGYLLAEEGYAVRTAGSGISGLDCARDFRPDVILCDFYLPDIDGLQVLRRLRAAGGEAFIIVVTAGCRGGVEERALRAEADLFFDKPVDLGRLRHALHAVQPRGPEPGGAPRAIN